MLSLRTCSCFFLPLLAVSAPPDESPNVDPLALQVLRAACDPIKQADGFSFQAVVAKETVGTNGQIITLFNNQRITVARPDKIRVEFKSAFHNLVLYDDQGKAVLFAPEEKLYANIDAANTIEQTLSNLEKRDIVLAVGPFLRNDPYASLTDGTASAAVIGRADVDGKTVTHLAFTEHSADWQLWVEGGEHPTPRRMEVVYKSIPQQPRVTVMFSDWNLNASPEPNTFIFDKPTDARQIEFIKISPNTGGE